MADIFRTFIEALTNPTDPNFWTAWPIAIGFITSLVIGAFSILKLLSNSRVARIERILTFALVEDYENWVRVSSKSQLVDIETLRQWLSEGKVALLGHDYSVFKNFIKHLRKNGRNMQTPDESWFLARSEEFKSSPKLERAEW